MKYIYPDLNTFELTDIMPVIKEFIQSIDKVNITYRKAYIDKTRQLLESFLKEKDTTLLITDKVFYEPIYFSSTEFRIHQNIKTAIHFTKDFRNSYQQIEPDVFSELPDFDNSYIKYSPVSLTAEEFDSYSQTEDPVIVIPYVNSNTRYLVIDGNHRVSACVKKRKQINVVCIEPLSIPDLFITETEKIFYELLRLAVES